MRYTGLATYHDFFTALDVPPTQPSTPDPQSPDPQPAEGQVEAIRDTPPGDALPVRQTRQAEAGERPVQEPVQRRDQQGRFCR
jgi:hypothetical protein